VARYLDDSAARRVLPAPEASLLLYLVEPSRDWRVAGKDVIHLAFNIRDAMEKGIRSINRTDTINLPFALLDLVQLISFHEVFAPGPLRIFQF
jgi:hypothetical protein